MNVHITRCGASAARNARRDNAFGYPFPEGSTSHALEPLKLRRRTSPRRRRPSMRSLAAAPDRSPRCCRVSRWWSQWPPWRGGRPVGAPRRRTGVRGRSGRAAQHAPSAAGTIACRAHVRRRPGAAISRRAARRATVLRRSWASAWRRCRSCSAPCVCLALAYLSGSPARNRRRPAHPDRCGHRHLRRVRYRRRQPDDPREARRRRLRDLHDLPVQHRRGADLPALGPRPSLEPARVRLVRRNRGQRHVVGGRGRRAPTAPTPASTPSW